MGKAIPLIIVFSLPKPEVGTDVDYLNSPLQRCYDGFSARLMRERLEDQRYFSKLRLDRQIHVGKVGQYLTQLLPYGASPRNRMDIDLGMLMKDSG